MVHERSVVTLLRLPEVALRSSQCSFIGSMVSYLGHKTRPGKKAEDNVSCMAVRKSLPPTIGTKIRFFGSVQRLQPLCTSFAPVPASLNVQTEKNQPLQSEQNVIKIYAFQKLKEWLMSLLILALSQHGQWYTMDTDACDYQIECPLLQ